jgi:hypothetical protein
MKATVNKVGLAQLEAAALPMIIKRPPEGGFKSGELQQLELVASAKCKSVEFNSVFVQVLHVVNVQRRLRIDCVVQTRTIGEAVVAG